MKLFLAVACLWAVAVFALRGDRYTEIDDRDVELFRAGQTYKYRLDTQISSGLASISEQHAVTRLQAEALVHFQSDRLVSLKLKNIRVASINQDIQDPETIQPIQMFKDEEPKPEELRLLELPCEFDYVDGLVERVRFPQQDQPWSKNIKKSVLNMLQLNLKQRKSQDVELDQPLSWKNEREQLDALNIAKPQSQQSRMFVMPEITLEGECQVTYTINPVNPRSKLIESYSDEQMRGDEKTMFNVTKTVDFHRCRKIADIRYGPKIEKPCQNCSTTQQEMEERKLDRTTIMRHVIVGRPTEKYGIKKVETISHYVFKTLNVEEEEAPMRTIVVARLNLVRADSDRSEIERELRRVDTNNKPESLLYSTEFDIKEKLYYMYGDDEYPRDQSPFDKVEDKVNKVENILKKLLTLWSDKVKGIDSEATLVYTRLVELLRMCNQKEIEQVLSRSKELSGRRSNDEESYESNAEDILIDALANAGTLNTIKVLAEKIKRRDIQPTRATRAIIQLKGLPAPSEKQMKVLMELCESNVCEQHGPCKQACWLTVGNLVGELCKDELTVDDAVDQLKPQCHQQLKKDFVARGMRQLEKVETRYKKISILKALGNAGLPESVAELEKIIRDIREDPLVRMQAIDSMRRLRAQIPHRIQRVLLPLVQNVRDRPEVRMMAVSQILATFPSRSVLDQIGYTLLREPSRQVKSYVYKAMKELSQSPIDVEKELAQHLKALVKLAGITEEEEETLIRGSRYYRIPVYSQAKKEGLFVDFESMFGSDNLLPKHLSVGMDTLFNGLLQKNAFELSLTQEDVEQWFEKLMDMYMDYSYGSYSSWSSSKKLRGERRSESEESSENYNNDFDKVVKGLSIRSRSNKRIDSDSNKRNTASPYAMLNIRYGDIDYAVLPLEEEFLPSSLKKIVVEGRQPTIRDLQDLIEVFQGRRFRAQITSHVMENQVKIPTSAGLPVRMWHVIPVLASVEGQMELKSSDKKASIKIHPMLSITHLKRVEVWSPIVRTGVDSTRTASVNFPLKTQLSLEPSQKTFQWTVEVPEKNFRVFNLHSLPLTYVLKESEKLQQNLPKVKRIENNNLVHRAQHIDTIIGKKNFGLPLKIVGEVHRPHRLNYRAIVAMLLTTENHLHVEFQPEEESPRKIVLTGEGRFFTKKSSDEDRFEHRQLKEFHSKSRFDTEMDSHYETEFDRDEESRFNKFVDDYEPSKVYKHFVAFELKSVGGRKDKQARVEIEANLDSQHRYAKAVLKVKRSPLPTMEESAQWTMRSEIITVLPDVYGTMQQYNKRLERQDGKQQRFVAKIDTEWGTESQKQKIRMNVNGEQGRNSEWRQKIERLAQGSEDSQKLRQQMIRKASFINKYDISADYENLRPETQSTLNTLATILKSWNFWQTKIESRGKSSNGQRDGQMTATIVIDPITHEHANVTMKTPTEIVRIHSLSLPMKMKPFKLVKPGQNQQSIDSFADIIRDYAVENRQECKVSGRTIRSFDDVIFKAPLTKCYTVLAKDCSSSSRPRFAVLIKKIDEQDKALKVLTPKDTIEVEPKGGKLVVKINGKHIEDEDKLEEKGIDYAKDSVRIATRDVTVRFDGEQAWVKIADQHKNTQCGLCGHYNDDSDDDFLMANNEHTSDLKSYHKSYTMEDNECKESMEDTYRREEYKKSSRRSNFFEDSEEDEEDEKKQQRRRRINENNEIDPIEKTETMEYNHKICFSVKPVKSCPEESYPAKTKEMKVGFACMDRTSSEARRLLREAQRADGPIRIPNTKPSFVETITVPSACEAY